MLTQFTTTISMNITLITTTEHPHTFRGLPSLSILHNPLHSPNFLFESTRINGIWCSLHKAVINFLICGSSQLSAKIANTAWRLVEDTKKKNVLKRVPFIFIVMISIHRSKNFWWIITYLSSALHAWWTPCTNPLAMSDFFKTSCNAVLISMTPPTAGAGATSL